MNCFKICTQAISLIQAHNCEEAEKILLDFLAQNIGNAECHELLGISLLLQDKLTDAYQYLVLAQKTESDNSRYLCNLAECLRKLGELEQAELNLNSALKLQPNYPTVQYNLACVFLAQDKDKKALKILKNLIKKSPDNASYHLAIADALRKTNQTGSSIFHYKKAIEINPKDASAYTNLGPLLLSIGKIDEALEHCKYAVKLAPKNGLPLLNFGRCLSELEQYDDAMDAFADALELIPDNAFLLTEIAKNWMLAGDLIQAEYWYMQALEKDKENLVAQCGLADTHREGNLLNEALEEINAILETSPKLPHAFHVRAKIYLDLGDIDECLDDYQKLIKLKPNQANLYSAFGHALENAGNLPLAEQQFRLALKKNPACIPALNGLAATQRGKLLKTDSQQMLALLKHKEIRDGSKAALHSGLGYYFDGIKNYNKAAEHLNQANHYFWTNKSKKGWSYDPDRYRRQVDTIIETFDKNYFSNSQQLGHKSHLPTFILGMPRSGTTLTEQILNSHPNILGIGERGFASESFSDLPNIFNQPQLSPYQLIQHLNQDSIHDIAGWYLDKLKQLECTSGRSNIKRIVDKMPDNYSQIGWILTLFPQAKIIHAKRDVRDIAVSCWMTQFGKIRWAFNLDHLAQRIIQYDRLMKYWRTIIPEKILETNYEDMISDQEFNSRRIISFLDLPWNDSCLNFHKQESVVRTASVTQVRQPLYKKSLQRWKRYEKPLQQLFDQLFGAEVDLYQ